MNTKFSEYKDFYKKVLAVAFPIMVQNGISNFVSLLDNIMIGRVGTEQMSGVAIVNQLLFIFYLCIFGAVSGAGIFTAQFYGQKNDEGVRDTFRFKLIISLVLLVLAATVLWLFNGPLISLYLTDTTGAGNVAETFGYGKTYLFIMLIGLLPFVIENVYSGTLRETGQTVVPMVASIVAVFVNLIFNYILIYGKFGAPALGVAGAAMATVLSRFVQMTIVVVWTHKNSVKNRFIVGAYKTLRIAKGLPGKIIKMGFPLLINETLWAVGVALQTQAFSTRGLEVVAGLNINSTINNVFNIVFIALGDAVAILVGQLLGEGKLAKAKQTAYRIIAFSVTSCVIIGAIMFITAPLFPQIYNTSDEVRDIATKLIRVTALVFPIQGYLHAAYFTIRSGGKTVITFLFDSVFLLAIGVPAAYLFSLGTGISIWYVFLFVNLLDLIKCLIGTILLKSGVWVNNIVGGE